MKYASQTATEKRDYQWNADSEEFRTVAEEEWSRWHDEYADSPWFGLISRHQKLLFLAGKIPTERFDYAHRRIFAFIVLQPENEEEKSQIINLTANLLLGKKDLPFYSWANEMAMAQETQTAIPGCPSTETVPQKEGNFSIGRCEYPVSDDFSDYRYEFATSLGNLVHSGKDFVVAVINHSASTFYKKVCNDLQQNAGIAVFSKSSPTKKKFPEPETHESVIQKGINFMKKHIPTVVFIVIILGIFFSFNGRVKKLNSTIQDLQSQLSEEIGNLKKGQVNLSKVVMAQNQTIHNQIVEIGNLKTDQNNLSKVVTPQNQTMQSLAVEIGNLKTGQTSLSNTITTQNQTIQNLAVDIGNLKTGQNALFNQVNNIETTFSKLTDAPTAPTAQTSGNNQPVGTEINN